MKKSLGDKARLEHILLAILLEDIPLLKKTIQKMLHNIS